ncbi:nonsense-mediated mRNA decay protein 2-like [Temnothorax curvispinosus]|uniref:Nonsense-mediated mRNA decay protein 2-like n=1 Tax=Temnothorax curvispinosus TaxID=300111 RepID=A0A6J1QT72_9HYME|nr:nonsense-mediated mRNA decay protein 2-like [Temnothorax curvispinosus]
MVANKTERGMSTKYKQFLNLSERHKRRRLAARQDDPNVCQSINNESDDTLSENEPMQISASHSAPSVSDNALYNNEESTTDVHEDTFNGDEEADDNEGIAEEEVQEQEVNTDGGDDDEENEESDADNTDAHRHEDIT